MKIAFTTSGDSLEAPIDIRFGRAPKILVYDLDTKAIEITDNTQNLNASQGAGIQAAQNVARTGAKHLVTGHCGPNAFKVLSAAGITIYTTDALTISEALDRFRSGSLSPANSADVEGHWT
ncbi:MAG TPA: NifB/NifX family molybdenum-iron cluster-binding protein [Deltaproteobacteria bacterium]|nr:NifB/NifX family molybdenum-iron cluster-binding protein [Deltaproteobacteria bacterium]HPR56069.1 NifB/NifX family molybdenum-iron cluster-binding protein [Deltaproteobacteria bacterium]HXK47865.1 NifB/NifX family molybdenum-iron cluster-binding protein [Deltaproteobacteria bacterium]